MHFIHAAVVIHAALEVVAQPRATQALISCCHRTINSSTLLLPHKQERLRPLRYVAHVGNNISHMYGMLNESLQDLLGALPCQESAYAWWHSAAQSRCTLNELAHAPERTNACLCTCFALQL